jgi:predicted  nucleic acid-binding Zn-ribbon protein
VNLFDRILGLTSEHQDQVDALVEIIEENEDLKKDKAELEEKVAELEATILLLAEQLDAERQKIHNIEQVIEDSIAAIRDMR